MMIAQMGYAGPPLNKPVQNLADAVGATPGKHYIPDNATLKGGSPIVVRMLWCP